MLKKIIFLVIIFSLIIFTLSAFLFYFSCFYSSWEEKIIALKAQVSILGKIVPCRACYRAYTLNENFRIRPGKIRMEFSPGTCLKFIRSFAEEEKRKATSYAKNLGFDDMKSREYAYILKTKSNYYQILALRDLVEKIIAFRKKVDEAEPWQIFALRKEFKAIKNEANFELNIRQRRVNLVR